MKELTKRETEFCRFYSLLSNEREAAYLAGYGITHKKAGLRLLQREEIRNKILEMKKENDSLLQAKSGLRRLAFGTVADAVKLIRDDTADPDSLDLFMVSDIKYSKGGAVEIKFYDRLKALESLALIENEQTKDTPLSFYSALESSAAALKGAKGESDENE